MLLLNPDRLGRMDRDPARRSSHQEPGRCDRFRRDQAARKPWSRATPFVFAQARRSRSHWRPSAAMIVWSYVADALVRGKPARRTNGIVGKSGGFPRAGRALGIFGSGASVAGLRFGACIGEDL
jgi:hypothetical protein